MNAVQIPVDNIAAVLNAQGLQPGIKAFTGNISTDTRTIATNDWFIAIKGPQFDGHDYLSVAEQKGAAVALVQQPVESDLPQLVVRDTLIALGQLAQLWRQQFDLPVIALTGSNGKTTVKEMLTSICSQQVGAAQVLATQGNLNNHIGVPLTLLRLRAQHRYAVIEMGANHLDEIAYLTQLVNPTVGLVNNAGLAHLEGFGSADNIARGKGELFSHLNHDATAVINAADSYADLWFDLIADRKTVTFGLPAADVWAKSEAEQYTVHLSDQSFVLKRTLPGEHNIQNAVAAIATACAAGISQQAMQAGLQAMSAVPGRLQSQAVGQWIVIDDTYNANPSSAMTAVDTLVQQPAPHYLVLGDMAELGQSAEAQHATVGTYAAQAGVDAMLTVGSLSQAASTAFKDNVESELHQSQFYRCAHVNDIDTASTLLTEWLAPVASGTVLIKGSRSMRMERITHQLPSLLEA